MKKIFFWEIILVVLLIGSITKASDLSQLFTESEFFFQPAAVDELEEKKYNLSICAIVTSLPKNLREWIEYHRLMGVNHFYLYNNTGRALNNPFLDVCISNEIVTLINWPMPPLKKQKDMTWALSTQIPAYENLIKLKANKESKWLIFMEFDEYLVPLLTESITELLNIYDDKPAITLSHRCFKKAERINNKELVIANVMLAMEPLFVGDRSVSKTIFKPDQSVGFTWAPYKCILKNGQSDFKIEIDQICINKYLENYLDLHDSATPKNKIAVDIRSISDNDIVDLLSSGYELEDQEKSILRFLPKLKKRMRFFTVE